MSILKLKFIGQLYYGERCSFPIDSTFLNFKTCGLISTQLVLQAGNIPIDAFVHIGYILSLCGSIVCLLVHSKGKQRAGMKPSLSGLQVPFTLHSLPILPSVSPNF